MKKLTVKDFILYNSPCFNCNDSIKFQLVSFTNDIKDIYAPYAYLMGATYFPEVCGTELETLISIGESTLLKIKIDCKTNKFVTNGALLTKYLADHILVLSSVCYKCRTEIRSSPLKFNINYGFLHPVEIVQEQINLADDNTSYSLHSNSLTNQTEIVVRKLNSTKPNPPTTINIPYIPLSKFKTRKKLLQKLKLYIVFS
jgi:hypothetical protein